MQVTEQDLLVKNVSRVKVVRQNPELNTFFARLEKLDIQWGLLGGFVRDAWYGKMFKDIDIAFACDKPVLMAALADANLEFSYNKFGGLRTSVGPLSFDFITVQDCFAVSEGILPYEGLKTFLSAATYNMDAGIINYREEEVLAGPLLTGINSGILDFVCDRHPFPRYAARRARMMLFKYKLRPSQAVDKYIDQNWKTKLKRL